MNKPLTIIEPDTESDRSAASSTVTERTASPEQLEQIRLDSERLETATPPEIIRWAVDRYFPQLTMATAFGPEGCVILQMLSEIQPRTHVFNLETGYQFQETLDLRDKIAHRDILRPGADGVETIAGVQLDWPTIRGLSFERFGQEFLEGASKMLQVTSEHLYLLPWHSGPYDPDAWDGA